MTTDPLRLMPDVDRATARLVDTARGLDESALREPSLLPGWSRGHVLAHVARNADSLVNLLVSARTGEVIPQYPSDRARDEDIEAGAGRDVPAHVADLRASAERFAEAVERMPPQAWSVSVQGRGGAVPAAALVWGRLREVQVHHVDLDAGYRPEHWPEAFGHRLLHEVVADMSRRPAGPALVLRPEGTGHEMVVGQPAGTTYVGGPVHALAGWLIGRAPDAGLTVTGADRLPTPPAWK